MCLWCDSFLQNALLTEYTYLTNVPHSTDLQNVGSMPILSQNHFIYFVVWISSQNPIILRNWRFDVKFFQCTKLEICQLGEKIISFSKCAEKSCQNNLILKLEAIFNEFVEANQNRDKIQFDEKHMNWFVAYLIHLRM